MIIFIIYVIGILPGKTKGKPPIAAYCYRPRALTITNQFMQMQTRKVHIMRTGGSMQTAKDET